MSELYADSAVHLSPHVSWQENIGAAGPDMRWMALHNLQTSPTSAAAERLSAFAFDEESRTAWTAWTSCSTGSVPLRR